MVALHQSINHVLGLGKNQLWLSHGHDCLDIKVTTKSESIVVAVGVVGAVVVDAVVVATAVPVSRGLGHVVDVAVGRALALRNEAAAHPD